MNKIKILASMMLALPTQAMENNANKKQPEQPVTPNPTQRQCSCRPRREIYKGVLYETHDPSCPFEPKTQVFK